MPALPGEIPRQWTAEDHDRIEILLELGLSITRIARWVVPPISRLSLDASLRKAGLRSNWPRGRPGAADRARQDALEAEIAARPDAEWLLWRTEGERRIRDYAARLGYDVVLTKRDEPKEADHVRSDLDPGR